MFLTILFRGGFVKHRTLLTAVAAVCALGISAIPPQSSAAPKTPQYAAYIVDTKNAPLGVAYLTGVNTGGVLFRIDVNGLPPGKHGMHIHEVGSCNATHGTDGKVTPFGEAGAHFDPAGTNSHKGPEGMGHAGDLPNLVVSANGHAVTTFFIDRLSVVPGPNNIVGRAIVIHANEDNYTDDPMNGGSGGRIACGEIGPLRVQ
jgi:Cu-Zn family superoxide dismutase